MSQGLFETIKETRSRARDGKGRSLSTLARLHRLWSEVNVLHSALADRVAKHRTFDGSGELDGFHSGSSVSFDVDIVADWRMISKVFFALF
ncbi:hypothetical protein N9955_00610 [bacterium]|nr:hypothetical protein [bacterium]